MIRRGGFGPQELVGEFTVELPTGTASEDECASPSGPNMKVISAGDENTRNEVSAYKSEVIVE